VGSPGEEQKYARLRSVYSAVLDALAYAPQKTGRPGGNSTPPSRVALEEQKEWRQIGSKEGTVRTRPYDCIGTRAQNKHVIRHTSYVIISTSEY
jgi:hypothetical protein